MRILLTGAGGLLGGRLATLLAAGHEVTAVVRTQPAPEGVPSLAFDLTDEAAVTAAFRSLRPDAVVHSAAFADAEACEREPDRAHRDNVLATRTLAAACHKGGGRFIAISTDLVFGGDRSHADEGSPALPLSVYGRTKLLGETEAANECPDAVILRVALVLGRGHGRKLTASESIAQRLELGESVTLYEDEWRSPVDPESVAEAIRALLDRPGTRGCFHLGGPERLTRAELGDRVARALKLDAGLIRRASQSVHRGAPRPRDVSLHIERARQELGYRPRALETVILEGRRARGTASV